MYIDTNDPVATRTRVYLNDELLSRCVAADDTEGYVVEGYDPKVQLTLLAPGQECSGKHWLTYDNTIVRVRTGRVKIEVEDELDSTGEGRTGDTLQGADWQGQSTQASWPGR